MFLKRGHSGALLHRSSQHKSALGFLGLVAIVALVLTGGAFAQAQPAATAPATPPATAPQPSVPLPGASEVIGYLNQTLSWHRQRRTEDQIATDPGDMLFAEEARRLDLEIVRLSFDFAKGAAAAHAAGKAMAMNDTSTTRYQNLQKAAASADAEVNETQKEVEGLRAKIASAPTKQRADLQVLLEETQSELALAQTRSQVLRDMMQFVGTGGRGSGSLSSQIEELQRSVPEAMPNASAPPPAASAGGAQTSPRNTSPNGVLDLIGDLMSLHSKEKTIAEAAASTDALAQTSKKVRGPMVTTLTQATQQGELMAKQADTSDSAQLADLKRQLDALTATFKQVSAVVVPLGKQSLLLDSYRSDLQHWQEAVHTQFNTELRDLLMRLAVFAGIMILIFLAAEIVRKAIVKYVHDVRRRYQFLLLRRIFLWCAIAITVAFALASEIGSIATFAGLITAGLAVALQNVILAIAGYFFLIGKYGVRVGDRVQISGITGDVVDVGLVRLHLMEIGGSGNDRHPTGRIVVFSNSVVFQPTASFFKQIPGTSFLWHEVSLILAPESDYYTAEKRMLGAVEAVYAGYHEHIDRQHRAMEHTLGLAVVAPHPRSQLRLTQAGLEVVIRYPVEVESATEIDDKITRELLNALNRPPRLRLVGSGVPNIQEVPGSAAAEAQPKAEPKVKAS